MIWHSPLEPSSTVGNEGVCSRVCSSTPSGNVVWDIEFLGVSFDAVVYIDSYAFYDSPHKFQSETLRIR